MIGTPGTSERAPIEGEWERLREAADRVDAQRHEQEQPPQAEPAPEGGDEQAARAAADVADFQLAYGLCSIIARHATHHWPELSYGRDEILAGAGVLAPLVHKYGGMLSGKGPAWLLDFYERFHDEIAAASFFATMAVVGYFRVQEARAERAKRSPHGDTKATAAPAEEGEPVDKSTVWHQEGLGH